MLSLPFSGAERTHSRRLDGFVNYCADAADYWSGSAPCGTLWDKFYAKTNVPRMQQFQITAVPNNSSSK